MTGVESHAYRAFLSYSHRDTRWAKRLHRALERFRVDKDLIGRETSAGPIPKTLRPIFRDREDFTAGESLNDQSIAALEASQFLIVICSPEAANSRYVNEEVRRFKAMGRAHLVIPVIVDGEPGQGDRECFPPALRLEVNADGNLTDRPTELLAADVREAGDGWDLAVAKVVARLVGLSTDEVFRRAERDRRRRGRIRFGVAAAILVLAVLGGVFAWRDYEKQQTLAEIETLVAQYTPADEADAVGPGAGRGLKEAITSIAQGAASDPRYRKALDLLKAGKPAEAEPLLKASYEDKKKLAAKTNKEAAEAARNLAAIARISDPANARTYYAEAASLDPEHVEGLYQHGEMQKEAGALDEAEAAFRGVIQAGKEGEDDYWLYWARFGLGDLHVARGDLNGAKAEYVGATVFVQRLAAADPSNAVWQYDLGISNERIGDVLMAQGDLAGALNSYQAKQGIISRLAAADPGNAGWQRDLSVSHDRIGDVLVGQGNLAAALESYRASLAIAERLAAADPENAGWRRDLSVSHDRIGDVLVGQGNLAAALESYRASLAIRERLAAADPGNAGWRRDLSVSHNNIGDVLVGQGNLAAALESYRASLAIRERLAAADPGNAGWQRDLSVSHNNIGDVLVGQGNLAAALESYRAGLAIAERLAAADPGNAGWQRGLSVSHNKIGDVLRRQGNLAAALESYRASLAIRERLAAADPENAGWQRDLSVSHNKIGDVLRRQGNLAAALESYRASLAIRERLAAADPGNAGWQRDLSVSHNKIGDVLVGQGNLAAALESYRAGLAIAERLAAADPGNAEWQRDLAISNERIGDMHARQGQTREAIAAFERALAAYKKLLELHPDDVQSRVFSVVPLVRLGDLKGKDGRKDLESALAILKPLAAANRLDANRTQWIGVIEAWIAEMGE